MQADNVNCCWVHLGLVNILLNCCFPHAAGVGGAGIFMSGFNDPITLVPKAQQEIKSAAAAGINYKWVVVMLGINDLLRGGKTADEIMPGIKQIWQMALDKGSNVLAIPPLPAPGFVSK